MRQQVYLKQNVLVEPLIDQWYAWSYLIAPASCAMYTANQLKIMQSYVDAPQVHLAAMKNPEMRGGPFINYGVDKMGEIKSLLKKTLAQRSHMLEFAEAVRTLKHTILTEASGYSLEPLYQKVPDILKGFVELVYDLENRPSIRFMEGLLYKSRFYNADSQSLALSLIEADQRPFALSTPVLESDDRVVLNAPFDDKSLDALFRMKSIPAPFAEACELAGIENDRRSIFSSFFTEDPPRQNPGLSGETTRIRYFGHACLLIESTMGSILCDPLVSYMYDNDLPRYTYADLPEVIDFALITHNHQDHCMLETLLQLKRKIKTIVVPRNNGGGLADPSLKLVMKQIGFDDVRDIEEAEVIKFGNIDIIGLPFLGEHADLNIRSKTAYALRVGGNVIVCAADSNNIEQRLYHYIRDLIGKIDVLFLGMECNGAPLSWLYGPLLSQPPIRKMDQSRRLDGSDAKRAEGIVDCLDPSHVYVYAMGQEPWLNYITSIQYTSESRPIVESNKFVQRCRERGVYAERLFGKKEIYLKPDHTVIANP